MTYVVAGSRQEYNIFRDKYSPSERLKYVPIFGALRTLEGTLNPTVVYVGSYYGRLDIEEIQKIVAARTFDGHKSKNRNEHVLVDAGDDKFRRGKAPKKNAADEIRHEIEDVWVRKHPPGAVEAQGKVAIRERETIKEWFFDNKDAIGVSVTPDVSPAQKEIPSTLFRGPANKMQAENKRLNKVANKLKKKNSKLWEKVNELGKTNAELTEGIRDCCSRNQRLEAANTELTEELLAKKEGYSLFLESEYNAWLLTKDDQKKETESLQIKYNKCAEELKSAKWHEGIMNKWADACERYVLKSENGDLGKIKRRFEKEIEELKERNANLQKALELEEMKYNGVVAALRKEKKTSSNLAIECVRLEDQLKPQLGKYKLQTEYVATLEGNIDMLRNEYKELALQRNEREEKCFRLKDAFEKFNCRFGDYLIRAIWFHEELNEIEKLIKEL